MTRLQLGELRRRRFHARETVDRLIGFLDATDGDPDLEPTLGYVAPGHVDEAEVEEDPEPSLGWTGIVNQASRNRLGGSDGQDHEKDDADSEDSDPGEDNGDLEPSLGGGLTHPSGHDVDLESDGNCDDEDSHDQEGEAMSASPRLAAHLRKHRKPHGVGNVTCIGKDGETFYLKPPWAK